MVSLTILGVILAGLAMSLDGVRRLNNYQLVRQRCVSAARAELESIAITGKAINESDFKRLWPKMSVSIEQSQGSGQWEGMQLVRVTTSAESSKNNVEIRLSRYFSGGMQHFKDIKTVNINVYGRRNTIPEKWIR